MSNKPMKKKKPGEKLNNVGPEYDSVREQTVLLEDMNQGIKTIAEQHGSIVEKLDEHSKELAVIKSELNTVKLVIKDIDYKTTKLEQGQQELKGEVREIKQKLDTAISEHEQRLVKLETVS